MRLRIWDSADQDKFCSLCRGLYFDCDIVLICFSIDLAKSLDNAQKRWAPEVQQFCGNKPTILVGCKMDLRSDKKQEVYGPPSQKLVTPRQARKVCRKIKAKKYLECSAATLENVDAVLDTATRLVRYSRTGTDYDLGKCVTNYLNHGDPWFAWVRRKEGCVGCGIYDSSVALVGLARAGMHKRLPD